MIFKSDFVSTQWDTWGYWHAGLYYLYYLITENDPGQGFGVATSADGVHWQDHGYAIRASSDMVEYLGTGAVWKAAGFESTGRFICNYSEWRREPGAGKPIQNILFAWSTDLIHWTKYGDDAMFRIDPRYYEPYGRWDCIFPLPRPEGGYWGAWTATPRGRANLNAGIGFGWSGDGLAWTALPPADVDPPADEAGAFHAFDGRVCAMFGKWDTGMVAYLADHPLGPYRLAGRNPVLLGGGMRHTYFARFLPTPGGVLVNHHTLSGKTVNNRPVTYAAPLKLAAFDGEAMRWRYWPGNEALKAEPAPLAPAALESGIAWLAGPLDFSRGVVVEGALQLPEGPDAPPRRICLRAGDALHVIRVRHGGVVEMETPAAGAEQPVHRADRAWPFGRQAAFRLLARRGMLEFYLDDQFMECYTMGCPGAATLQVGAPEDEAPESIRFLAAWRMSLAAE